VKNVSRRDACCHWRSTCRTILSSRPGAVCHNP
jgi:hypothetical protein